MKKVLHPVTTTTSRAERFEVAFNRIHQKLKQIVKSNEDAFVSLLRTGRRDHDLVNYYFDELIQFAKLRNSLVHYKVEVGVYIADPYEEVVTRLETIDSIFHRPNYALFIATRQVISFSDEDTLQTVVDTYKKHYYSQYPVYCGPNCVGLIHMGDLLLWLAEHFDQQNAQLHELKLGDIDGLLTMDDVTYLKKSTDVFEIEDIFATFHKNGKALEVAVVTENGLHSEKPLGIITAWDLIEIDYTNE